MKAEESHCFETENKGADIMATTDNTFGDAGSIAALMRSDEQAWSDLIKHHQRIIDAVYRRYRLRLEDAADPSQTVWIKATDNNPIGSGTCELCQAAWSSRPRRASRS